MSVFCYRPIRWFLWCMPLAAATLLPAACARAEPPATSTPPAVATQPLLATRPSVSTQPTMPDATRSAVASARLSGRLVAVPGQSVAGQVFVVAIRLPRPRQWEVKTGPDGSFVIADLPPDAKGTILLPRLPGYVSQAHLAQAYPSLQVRLDTIRFDSPPPGLDAGTEVRLLQQATVGGTVTDDEGKLVGDVAVVAQPMGYAARTDSQGRYGLSMLPGVPAHLQIRWESPYENLSTEPFTPDPGQQIEMSLVLRRKAQRPHEQDLTGRVVDAQGRPVAGATICLGNSGVCPLELTGVTLNDRGVVPPTWIGGDFGPAHLTSDRGGRFAFDRLYSGQTDLWAEAPDGTWAWLRDVPTNARSVRVVLSDRPSQTRPSMLSFAGTVADPDGKPLSGANVVLLDGDAYRPTQLAQSQSDAQGSFVLEAAPPGGSGRHLRLLCVSPKGLLAWRTLPAFSGAGLRLQVKREAAISGRIVGPQGQGVGEAAVRLHMAEDPDYGRLFFAGPLEGLAPSATSNADGQFILRSLPQGGTASLRASHARHGPQFAWYIGDSLDQQSAEDIQLPEGISFEGTVRFASGVPAAGALVTVGFPSGAIGSATADPQGRYRIGGLDEAVLAAHPYVLIRAETAEQPALWQGQVPYETKLAAGDAISGLDVVLAKSFAVRQTEWKQRSGRPTLSRYRVAVLCNTDPAHGGKQDHEATLSVYDAGPGSGDAPQWQYRQLSIGRTAGANHALAASPKDRSLYVCENTGGRVVRLHSDGSLASESAKVGAQALAVDPKTGDAWVLTSDGTIGGNGLLILDNAGKNPRRHDIRGFDIAYSHHDDCFWVAGRRLQKVSRVGEVLADEAETRFAWVALSVAVNERDGSAWVVEGEHPQVPGSARRLLVFSSDGKLRRQVPITARCVVLDADRGVAWATTDEGLAKLDLDGNVLAWVPLDGSSLAVEPETGCLWVAAADAVYRLDPQGAPLWFHALPGGSHKWLCLIPTHADY